MARARAPRAGGAVTDRLLVVDAKGRMLTCNPEGNAQFVLGAPCADPPVLIGHAASPTPYRSDTPRPRARTDRTRRIPHPVLIGHAASVLNPPGHPLFALCGQGLRVPSRPPPISSPKSLYFPRQGATRALTRSTSSRRGLRAATSSARRCSQVTCASGLYEAGVRCASGSCGAGERCASDLYGGGGGGTLPAARRARARVGTEGVIGKQVQREHS